MDDTLYLACPACAGINRVPGSREVRSPTCGRCKAALDPAAHPVEVSDEGLERLVRASPVPVLVDFWAPWCGPCRAVAPHLAALAQRHAGRLIVAKVNTDQHNRTAGALGVQAIPTLAVWQNGQLQRKEPGARTGQALEDFVRPYLG